MEIEQASIHRGNERLEKIEAEVAEEVDDLGKGAEAYQEIVRISTDLEQAAIEYARHGGDEAKYIEEQSGRLVVLRGLARKVLQARAQAEFRLVQQSEGTSRPVVASKYQHHHLRRTMEVVRRADQVPDAEALLGLCPEAEAFAALSASAPCPEGRLERMWARLQHEQSVREALTTQLAEVRTKKTQMELRLRHFRQFFETLPEQVEAMQAAVRPIGEFVRREDGGRLQPAFLPAQEPSPEPAGLTPELRVVWRLSKAYEALHKRPSLQVEVDYETEEEEAPKKRVAAVCWSGQDGELRIRIGYAREQGAYWVDLGGMEEADWEVARDLFGEADDGVQPPYGWLGPSGPRSVRYYTWLQAMVGLPAPGIRLRPTVDDVLSAWLARLRDHDQLARQYRDRGLKRVDLAEAQARLPAAILRSLLPSGSVWCAALPPLQLWVGVPADLARQRLRLMVVQPASEPSAPPRFSPLAQRVFDSLPTNISPWELDLDSFSIPSLDLEEEE